MDVDELMDRICEMCRAKHKETYQEDTGCRCAACTIEAGLRVAGINPLD